MKYTWHPATAAQKTALDSDAEILFFGGSAGSLKTATMLMDAAQEYENPNLRAIIFRSSYAEMADILDKTNSMYPPLGGTYVGSPKYTWTFESGAKIRFGYVKTDEDWRKYLGPRYSFIGWDESTLHTEKQVRNLLGRLSSTDKTLRLRCRLGSNPGGIGAAWHQELFLRGQCPVHDPDRKSAQPGVLYRDRYWPSDKKPIKASVAFVPGKLSDHRLLDESYRLRLDEMAGGAAMAMLEGCWCELEGSYFSFLNTGFIRPIAEVPVDWWHSHFLSFDFGFGGSSSSVGLYVRGPAEVKRHISIPGIRSDLLNGNGNNFAEGKIRKLGELVVPHVPAYELAKMAIEAFVKPNESHERRRIVAAYLDPSNFKDIGDGHTIADQINEVLAPWDIACERASNDRIGGWQLLYKMLRTGEFEICDTCPKTFESLRTRLHDPTRLGDVKKVPGDPLDDVADETRYALYTFIQQADKPREMVLAEHIAGIDRSTREGMTSSAIRWQQKNEELNALDEPIRLGSRRLGMGRRR